MDGLIRGHVMIPVIIDAMVQICMPEGNGDARYGGLSVCVCVDVTGIHCVRANCHLGVSFLWRLWIFYKKHRGSGESRARCLFLFISKKLRKS